MERTWSTREYSEGDEKGILKLTEAIYGKIPDTDRWLRWWNWRYRDCPSGPPIVWVAESDGKLIGQYLITRVRMKVGNEVITGSQSESTMTHPEYRRQGMFEVLAHKTYEAAAKEGVPIVYGFPNKYSYPGFISKLDWLDVCSPQTMIKPLKLENILRKYIPGGLLTKTLTMIGNLAINLLYGAQRPPQANLTITRISSFDERINALWKRVSNDYEIIVVRDREYLNWRYVNIPDVAYTI